MKSTALLAVAAVCLGSLALSSPAAALEYDQNVTPDAIFGNGNINGFYTTDCQNGIELGLRSKLRYDAACQPQNVFNSNGDGTYSWPTGANPCNPTRSIWNFEWSVNTNHDGTSGLNLDDLTYLIELDRDPSCGLDNVAFDPISPSMLVPCWDHSLGDNGTPNGGGTEVNCNTSPGDYALTYGNYNVAQNSWIYNFYVVPFIDPNANGVYTISLTAFDATGATAARTTIDVIVGTGAVNPDGSPCGFVCCSPCDLAQLMAPVLGGDIAANEDCANAPPVLVPPDPACCALVDSLLSVLPPRQAQLASSHPCYAMPPSSPATLAASPDPLFPTPPSRLGRGAGLGSQPTRRH